MRRPDAVRRAARASIAVALAFGLVGCGAGATKKGAEEPRTQDGEPAPAAESAPTEEAEDASGGAQAPAAAPLPGPQEPGYGHQEGRGQQQQPTTASPEERDDAAQANIDGLTDALDRALALSTPDCASGAVLKDQICDLSAAICRLAADKPANGELRARCTDAQNRCDRATSRVKGACP